MGFHDAQIRELFDSFTCRRVRWASSFSSNGSGCGLEHVGQGYLCRQAGGSDRGRRLSKTPNNRSVGVQGIGRRKFGQGHHLSRQSRRQRGRGRQDRRVFLFERDRYRHRRRRRVLFYLRGHVHDGDRPRRRSQFRQQEATHRWQSWLPPTLSEHRLGRDDQRTRAGRRS